MVEINDDQSFNKLSDLPIRSITVYSDGNIEDKILKLLDEINQNQ
jgi:hypothetical protein